MWIHLSIGVGLRNAPAGVGASDAEYSMVERAPLRLAHQRTEGARGFAIPSSARPRPSTQSNREASPSRWNGPVIDLAAEPGPIQRGQMIDILV